MPASSWPVWTPTCGSPRRRTGSTCTPRAGRTSVSSSGTCRRRGPPRRPPASSRGRRRPSPAAMTMTTAADGAQHASRRRAVGRRTMPDPQVSSGCYVYGIVGAADIPPQECHGVGDARVDYVRSGPLAAAVSAYDQQGEVSLRADLTAHTRVLDWLAERTTVIPMAFGTVTDDATAVVESIIGPGAEMLVDLLEWLRGTSQFNLRGIYHRERGMSEGVLADPGLTRLHERTRDLPQGQPDPELIRLGEGVSAALDRQK